MEAFTVVQDEQQRHGSQVVGQRFSQGTGRLLGYVESCGHAVGHEPRIGKRGQFDEPYPIGVLLKGIGRDLKGQSRLATTPRSGEA